MPIADRFKISAKDRERVRTLATRQAEIAFSPANLEKERLWYAHNDYVTREPVVTIEQWTFQREFAHLIKPECESDFARGIENGILWNFIAREYIGDDRVMPREYCVGTGGWIKPFDIDVKRERSIGDTFAFKIDYAIKDLEADYGLIKKSPVGASNMKDTREYYDAVDELIGDILPVKLVTGANINLSANVYYIMGLETMMTGMIDYPELFHKMMNDLTNDYLEMLDTIEKAGAVFPNNSSNGVCQGTYGYTNLLPQDKHIKHDTYTMNDVWGYMDSQETSEISPQMYHEFFFPYYERISRRFGRINYGCCESVSAIWDDSVSKYHNVSKVSISPWCDEEKIGDSLRGKKVIYHRKPFPNYLGVDEEFDEAGFAAHIEKTIKSARGCYFELSYRDVYSLQGDLYRGKKAYEVIRKCIDKWFE
ncbi:hypothetical protein FACS1894219_03540 [Clostridia bacterium]|nr:hypothetical protein FACS1894219_03540 [Clostridia bacterium]